MFMDFGRFVASDYLVKRNCDPEKAPLHLSEKSDTHSALRFALSFTKEKMVSFKKFLI